MASDKKRMLELGGWLERYLNPDIKAREYKALATEAIKFYGIDFKLSENDISLQVAKFIESQPEGERDNYIDAAKSFSGLAFLVKKTLIEKVAFDACIVGELKYEDLGFDDYDAKELNRFRLYLTSGSKEENALISIVNGSIDRFYSSEKYQGILTTLTQKGMDISDIESKKNEIKDLLCQRDLFLWWIEPVLKHLSNLYYSQEKLIPFFKNKVKDEFYIEQYNELIPFLSGSHANNFKIVQRFSDKYDHAYVTNEHPSFFPWDVVTSRIGIDFLMLGGQEYFLFCKHCGRFTVAKRKGCKKYCSDICRTAQGRKEKAI